jgi:hypothetical protein
VDLNATIRGEIVAAALAEVAIRARDLIEAGCDPSEVADGMRAAGVA